MVFRSEASGVEVVVALESMSRESFWHEDLQTIQAFLKEEIEWNLGQRMERCLHQKNVKPITQIMAEFDLTGSHCTQCCVPDYFSL